MRLEKEGKGEDIGSKSMGIGDDFTSSFDENDSKQVKTPHHIETENSYKNAITDNVFANRSFSAIRSGFDVRSDKDSMKNIFEDNTPRIVSRS